MPGLRILLLGAHQCLNLVKRDVGQECVGKNVQNLLVVAQQGRGGDFFDDSLDDRHLILTSLVVTACEGISLPGKGQCLLPVEMHGAGRESERFSFQFAIRSGDLHLFGGELLG